MQSDQKIHRLMARAMLDKSINSLLGIIEGIAIDGVINPMEAGFLHQWLGDHDELHGRHPFNELAPVVRAAIADGILSSEERKNIKWLCERLLSTNYYDKTTADMQRLEAILVGIVADREITLDELSGLSTWIEDHEALKTCWPYDEVDTLVTTILKDKQIDEREHSMLKEYFSGFLAAKDQAAIGRPATIQSTIADGLCVVCPEVTFAGSTFCFTGASARFERAALAEMVIRLGGTVTRDLTKAVRYLVVCAEGNLCWAYACYGRKVEEAVELRKKGSRVMIIHENDFHDAVADHGR